MYIVVYNYIRYYYLIQHIRYTTYSFVSESLAVIGARVTAGPTMLIQIEDPSFDFFGHQNREKNFELKSYDAYNGGNRFTWKNFTFLRHSNDRKPSNI